MDTMQNDKAFEPLFRAIAKMGLTSEQWEETVGNYMFMYEDKGVFAYKHSWSRKYVYIEELGIVQDGTIETGAPDEGKPTNP